jgi:hypothetical protein
MRLGAGYRALSSDEQAPSLSSCCLKPSAELTAKLFPNPAKTVLACRRQGPGQRRGHRAGCAPGAHQHDARARVAGRQRDPAAGTPGAPPGRRLACCQRQTAGAPGSQMRPLVLSSQPRRMRMRNDARPVVLALTLMLRYHGGLGPATGRASRSAPAMSAPNPHHACAPMATRRPERRGRARRWPRCCARRRRCCCCRPSTRWARCCLRPARRPSRRAPPQTGGRLSG